MSEPVKKDERRWFERVTLCRNLNAERVVEFVEMEQINPSWAKPKSLLKIEEEDVKKQRLWQEAVYAD